MPVRRTESRIKRMGCLPGPAHNEYELDLLRQRSLSARYEKARRGELVVGAPLACCIRLSSETR